MELLKKSDQFRELLESLSQQNCITDKVTFLEEYEVSVLGVDTITPFTNFVGQRDRLTVIISKNVLQTMEDSNSNLSTSLEGLEILVDLDTSGNSMRKSQGEALIISSQGNVNIGQPLVSNRVYLTGSSPLYEGWSDAGIKTTTSAEDGGLDPVPLDSARFIASLYSLGSRKAKKALPDVWIACEQNQRRIVALGCAFDGCSSPVRVIAVEEQGVVSEADVKSSSGSTNATSSTAFSEYDIMGHSLDGTEQITDVFKIQLSWSDPDGMLTSPVESSDAILKVSNTPGGLFSPVLAMYQELKCLHTLCKIASGEMDWPNHGEDSEEVLILEDKRVEEVENFIQDIANPFNRPADVTVISPSSDHMIFEPRTDLDFTEQLWVLCHKVTSFSELQHVCAKVFKAVLQGKVQPFVHRLSTSQLSGLLRQVLLNPDGGLSLEDIDLKFQLLLSESKLLPCIIQIGIEKMKNDYRSFFVRSDVCSAEQLERFFHHCSPSSSPIFAPSSSPLEQCLQLCRLHSVLELNAAVMKMIRLPSTIILSTFTKAAMEVFTKDFNFQPFHQSPVFSLPLPAYSPVLKSVVALCSKLSPVIWCMAAQDERSRKQKKTVYLTGTKPLLNYLLDNAKNGECYYLYKCSSEVSA